MSNPTALSPRPVSLVTIVFVLALFGAFAFLVSRYYHPMAIAPQNQSAENLPKDLAWKATPGSRREALATLREKQAKQAVSYGWVDQKTGVVQLPIERAMELTVERYGAKK
jgi:hypothetical protein